MTRLTGEEHNTQALEGVLPLGGFVTRNGLRVRADEAAAADWIANTKAKQVCLFVCVCVCECVSGWAVLLGLLTVISAFVQG
jgi:uncharacterized membrane protein YphA (DoxX/SURF4 family)